ncbi:ribosomal RNA 16S methyltransferase RsmE [Acidocella aminolytica 101 = DSM 11237]|jgi:16S rRNA (uracil1498-N3)-methyltransferase|uniref:Ribosomal RNA small subunit methyltransferase E n=3 Tax=Acidocella TaxID=50709 RepID=A0A0D6PMQ2_9PROT|nr:ribosomal RNA 16S methyltransferase RsmE [Acidocella aminolytica 101 = DSM 11237]GBQ32470.1 16S ribosomal RNA methyltransferase RsmE [Acidocella aminolytica 101 = DSM 11237]
MGAIQPAMADTSIRLYVPDLPTPGEAFAVSDGQAHYLANVMRLAEGDSLRVFNGMAGEWRAAVRKISRKAAVLEALTQTRPPAPEPDAWLCFALLKRQKTDMVVEKATELGVSVIQPIITARTNADHVNLGRLHAIATEAAEQCERLHVPEIRAPLPVMKLMADWPARPLFVADERRTAALLGPATGPTALMIGPEGGFTDQELEAIARTPIITRVSLGRRILRAETAAIAGLALHLAALP